MWQKRSEKKMETFRPRNEGRPPVLGPPGLLDLSPEPLPSTALAPVTSLTLWLGWSLASPITDAPMMHLLCLVCGLGFIWSTQGFLARWTGGQPLNTRGFLHQNLDSQVVLIGCGENLCGDISSVTEENCSLRAARAPLNFFVHCSHPDP